MRKPKGAGAVMADHAPSEVEADTPQMRLYRALNYFPTPPWAGRAGAELIQRLDPGCWMAWEPACGEGHLASALGAAFAGVYATDIHPHGWAGQHELVDFLDPTADAFPFADWIVTNPPFAHAEAFVRLGLTRARRGVAVLCRSGWMDSHGRETFFYPRRPAGLDALIGEFPGLAVEGVFFERVPMHLGRWEPSGSSATPYSWFVFLKPEIVPPYLRAAREALGAASLTVPFPVGTKARLTHPDDARLWGAKAAAPLFEGVGDAG